MCDSTGKTDIFKITPGEGKAAPYKEEGKPVTKDGVKKLYNEWMNTCPFSLVQNENVDDETVQNADTVDDLINYRGSKEVSKRAYDDLMNEIYRRFLVMKSFGIDSSEETRDSSLIDTLNERIKQQQRYTFSLLSKAILFTFFVILVIITIFTNNKSLYFLTFITLSLMIFLNLTVMQNNI